MSLRIHNILFVLIVCQNVFTLVGQDLTTSLTNLKNSLVQLEQALNPRIPNEYSTWFAKLSEQQKQDLLKLSPDQLEKLLAGQAAPGTSAPPPPPGPGKMPPPPPPGPGKGPRTTFKLVQLLSDEEKANITNEYTTTLQTKLEQKHPTEKRTILQKEISNFARTRTTIESSLNQLQESEKLEQQKKIEIFKLKETIANSILNTIPQPGTELMQSLANRGPLKKAAQSKKPEPSNKELWDTMNLSALRKIRLTKLGEKRTTVTAEQDTQLDVDIQYLTNLMNQKETEELEQGRAR